MLSFSSIIRTPLKQKKHSPSSEWCITTCFVGTGLNLDFMNQSSFSACRSLKGLEVLILPICIVRGFHFCLILYWQLSIKVL